MTQIGVRRNEICKCGHRGGRHADLGDGFCHDCSCPGWGKGPLDVSEIAAALAAVEDATRAVAAAEEARHEAQRALARLLGRPEAGKDFDFEAEHRARDLIVQEALRPHVTEVARG